MRNFHRNISTIVENEFINQIPFTWFDYAAIVDWVQVIVRRTTWTASAVTDFIDLSLVKVLWPPPHKCVNRLMNV